MNNLQDVWRRRFVHYLNEIQKYMRFVFTGHMAIVILFAIGAGGYQYSEWLKVAPKDFPAIWLCVVIVGILLSFSKSVTLIREPDEVYLLPLESKLPEYFKKALKYTLSSQVVWVVFLYLVTWPMLRQVAELSPKMIIIGLVFAILLKWWNIRAEFLYRWANNGHHVWLDRLIRILLSVGVLAGVLFNQIIVLILMVIFVIVYPMLWKKARRENPFPYEHFVKLEENRMLGIYRFANYFTDVPHIHGSIKRRAWLDGLYKLIPYAKAHTEEYLVFRSFIRTDDHYYLWLRLTAIAAVGAAFIHIPLAIGVFVAALAFATAIQLKQALTSSNDFRMDMLYPLPKNARKLAAIKIVRYALIKQAIFVILAGIGTPYFFVQGFIILIVGEITLRMSK